jgi:diguanylate cyclase (GGDEF)-like protein
MIPIAQQHLGIAIVEDDIVFRRLISALLAKQTQFHVFEAASGEALDQILSAEAIDCILLDYNLGDENGFAIMQRIGLKYQSVPPIIMLTGDGRESTVIKALRMGMEDYLSKRDLNAAGLIAAIDRVVRKDRDAKREKAEYLRLIQASDTDPATGLHSRSQLENRLARIVSLPLENRSSYALIAIELTELDAIIARFGLNVGDQVLRKFAERLRAAARSTDTFGRYSENIFLVIVETGDDRAVLRNMHEKFLSDLSFRLDLNATSIQISARVGNVRCHEVRRDGVLTPVELVEAAMATLSSEAAVGQEPVPDGGSSIDVEKTAAPSHDQNARSGLRTSDRRKEARKRVLKRGQIVVPSLGLVVDCTVRNLSIGGATVRIDVLFAPPPEFDLAIVGDGTTRRVRVQWQVGTDLGVEYID